MLSFQSFVKKALAKTSQPSLPGAAGPSIILRDLKPFLNENVASTSQPTNSSSFQIIGRVTSRKTNDYFNVIVPQHNKSYRVYYPEFLPVSVGDAISCKVEFLDSPAHNEPKVKIIKPPFVQTPCDEKSITNMFIQALRRKGFGKNHADFLYKRLNDITEQYKIKDVDNVARFLTFISDSWMCLRKNQVLRPIAQVFEYLFNPGTSSILRLTPPKPRVGEKDTAANKYAKHLLTWWKKCNDMRQLYLLGLTNKEIVKADRALQDLYNRLLINPYTIPSVPLEKCQRIDQIVERTVHPTDYTCGQILRDIWLNQDKKGWTCTQEGWVVKRHPEYFNTVDRLIAEFGLISHEWPVYQNPDDVEHSGFKTNLYIEQAYQNESNVLEWIKTKMTTSPVLSFAEPVFPTESLDENQRDAIRNAMHNNISIMTGPAGTGKTTSIKDLIANLQMQHVEFQSCSFTGKAVSRIRYVTKVNAQTMDRMIATSDQIVPFQFLIIDEASMVSVNLMSRFIRSFNHPYHVILIGDPNQLPPIEYGSFFTAVIESYSIHTSRLTTIHRVANSDGQINGIIQNTTRISKWNMEQPFTFTEADNFNLIDCGINKYIDIYKRCRDELKLDIRDFVTISPYRSEVAVLNKLCQQIYNSGKPFIECPDKRRFYIDDKVMMLDNDYERNIMNGDEGFVTQVDPTHITVLFNEHMDGGNLVKVKISATTDREKRMALDEYDSDIMVQKENDKDRSTDSDLDDYVNDLTTDNIDHSFAITCHKSQGGEWKHVWWYLGKNRKPSGRFLNRNLIYTGLSRGKEFVNVTGSVDNSALAIATPPAWRCECLASRLRYDLPRLHKVVTEDPLEDIYCENEEGEFSGDDCYFD